MYTTSSRAETYQSGYLTYKLNEDGTLTVVDYDRSLHQETDPDYSLVIPNEAFGKDVVSVAAHVFSSKTDTPYTFSYVEIQKGITIGEGCFQGSVIGYKMDSNTPVSLKIGATGTKKMTPTILGAHAFEDCVISADHASTIRISATTIEDYCFYHTHFPNNPSDKTLPVSNKTATVYLTLQGESIYGYYSFNFRMRSIGDHAFAGSNLEYLESCYISTIGKDAFCTDSLKYAKLNSTGVYENFPFSNNSSLAIEIADDYQTLDDYHISDAQSNVQFYLHKNHPLLQQLSDMGLQTNVLSNTRYNANPDTFTKGWLSYKKKADSSYEVVSYDRYLHESEQNDPALIIANEVDHKIVSSVSDAVFRKANDSSELYTFQYIEIDKGISVGIGCFMYTVLTGSKEYTLPNGEKKQLSLAYGLTGKASLYSASIGSGAFSYCDLNQNGSCGVYLNTNEIKNGAFSSTKFPDKQPEITPPYYDTPVSCYVYINSPVSGGVSSVEKYAFSVSNAEYFIFLCDIHEIYQTSFGTTNLKYFSITKSMHFNKDDYFFYTDEKITYVVADDVTELDLSLFPQYPDTIFIVSKKNPLYDTIKASEVTCYAKEDLQQEKPPVSSDADKTETTTEDPGQNQKPSASTTEAKTEETTQNPGQIQKFSNSSEKKDTEAPKTDTVPQPKKPTNQVTVKHCIYKVTAKNSVALKKVSNRNLKKLSIPSTITLNGKKYKVTSIEKNACAGMKKLTQIELKDNIRQIKANAFANCKKLKKISLGRSVTRIDKKAFYNCNNIKILSISSKKLTYVGKKSLSGITKKTTILVPKNKLDPYLRLLKKGL